MADKVTLGGDRLGSGEKQTVERHNYQMNSFNLEQDWKSTMMPGALYPCLKVIGTNHGTFDIDVDAFFRTLPTQGPLFGSFKLQVDLFSVPIRLYQGILHNNPLKIGLNMNRVFLPKMVFETADGEAAPKPKGSNDYDYQIHPSSLEKYLGLSGLGHSAAAAAPNANVKTARKLQCIPELAYYDIFKCYYSNKQEEDAYVITPGVIDENKPSDFVAYYITADNDFDIESAFTPLYTTVPLQITGKNIKNSNIVLTVKRLDTGNQWEESKTLEEWLSLGEGTTQAIASWLSREDAESLSPNLIVYLTDIAKITGRTLPSNLNNIYIEFSYEEIDPEYNSDIVLTPFKLENIDYMRYFLLSNNSLGSECQIVNDTESTGKWGTDSGLDSTGLPYSALVKTTSEGISWNAFHSNGLVVKTYQSDLYNNWLSTDFVDQVTSMTQIDVSGGSFSVDTLNLAEKFYNLLNRIVVGSGTYEDWQEAVYGEGAVRKAETPMYIGGMSAEIMFEEVISSAETNIDNPLGTLGGKGTLNGMHGGRNIHCKCEEPSYIMAIASITPRIAYSQGNDWDRTELDTLDDLHKPELDGIGFQDLMVENMAWWNTVLTTNGNTVQHRDAVGKQTAWIHYQTAVDKCYGDFAKQDGYSYMVLNRNYTKGDTMFAVDDLTTYIDPKKYNYAFAVQDLYAQNFWGQIHFRITARRKMGAQQLPNL